jgi:hypothetical protein
MSNLDVTTSAPSTQRPRRINRPERIIIGGEACTRNDIKAKKLGHTERTLNRGDAKGAPYLLVGGVKYRPDQRYDAWLLGRIKTRKPTPSKPRKHTAGTSLRKSQPTTSL